MRFARSKDGGALVLGPVLHKALDVSLGRSRNSAINLLWRLTSRCDHAGLSIYLDWMSFEVELQVYDVRHWDEENGRWFAQGTEIQHRNPAP